MTTQDQTNQAPSTSNQDKLSTSYRVHPGIGMARVGDSPTDFYISPETPAGLPIACDASGNTTVGKDGREKTTSSFKDSKCRIKRQAARFQIFVYDDENPEGRPLKKGEMIYGPGSQGKLVDIEWTVYLANKKSVWYQFQELQGEHGYAPDHPLRNADITDETERQNLIIDPGPQTVYAAGGEGKPTQATFAQGENPGYAQTFPPPLSPNSVDTLGEIKTDDELRLLVLGAFGNSGSYKTGFGEPRIEHFANNEGWFDDIADGPVQAKLAYWDELDNQLRYVSVEQPAWVVVGQPNYVPELLNVITLDEVVYDTAVRHLAYDTNLYGIAPFDKKKVSPDDLPTWRKQNNRYNPGYYPLFFKEIWPILVRPQSMEWVTSRLGPGNEPHHTGARGNFNICQLSVPPYEGQPEEERRVNAQKRNYIFQSLRGPGHENEFLFQGDSFVTGPDNRLVNAPLMPLLSGDNPITNTLPSKFLRLTDTQLFLLEQWRDGKFVNECDECFTDCESSPDNPDCKQVPYGTYDQPPKTGPELDRGVLANALGGAFCPGGEVGWILRNPDIYVEGYRIQANREYIPGLQTSYVSTTPGVEYYERPQLSQQNAISDGLEPGDVTKYNSTPWQSDFNECSNQDIDVSYQEWNQTYPDDPNAKATTNVLWWPAHRPDQVQIQLATPPGAKEQFRWVNWARGIPQGYVGDLKMVTAWKDLGFIFNIGDDASANFVEVERNDKALGGAPTEQGCGGEG